MPPSYIRVRAVVWAYGRGQTDTLTQRHTDTHTEARDHNTFCVVYDSRKCNKRREDALFMCLNSITIYTLCRQSASE